MAGNADLARILERVRKLIEMSEAPIAPGATEQERAHTLLEQTQARAMADALMFKYKVQEATAREAQPVGQRTPPTKMDIELGHWNNDILEYFVLLSQSVAKHCDCLIRNHTKWTNTNSYSTVYGFESELAYFNVLYTTVRLHMVGILVPRVDPQLSLDENCYRLHNAGYNWLDIGALYGWNKYKPAFKNESPVGMQEPYRNNASEEFMTKFQVGGLYKRAYYRACKVHGVKPQIISAGGTAAYRRSAAEGYVSMISQRLREMRSGRSSVGSEIVLQGGKQDLQAYFRAENPELFVVVEPSKETRPAKRVRMPRYVPTRFDDRAYAVGANYAKTADLGTGRTGTGEKNREIG